MKSERDYPFDNDDDDAARFIAEAELAGTAYIKGTEGRNDPDYLSDLEETKRQKDDLANRSQVIYYCEGPTMDQIVVGTTHPRHRPKNRDFACQLSEHLEAPVVVIPYEKAGDSPILPQKAYRGQPAHKFFKGSV